MNKEVGELPVDVLFGHTGDSVACTFTGPALKYGSGIVGILVGEIPVGLYDLLTGCTASLKRKVKTFISETKIETVCKVGHPVTQIYLVVIVDYTVMIHVDIFHITGFHVILEDTVAGSNPICDFLFVLEQAICFVSPEIPNRFTIFRTIK